MRDDDPQSSFQSPENYREYAKDAYRALERYQKIRRPLMFHVLLWTIIFKPPHFYWSFYLVHTIAEATGQFPQFIFNSHSWYIINLISTFIISLLALGIVNCFRHLEDGFQAKETDKPIFTLKTRFRFTGSAIKEVFVPPVDNYFKGLKWEWFWRTWFFYPAVVTGLLGLFNLLLKIESEEGIKGDVNITLWTDSQASIVAINTMATTTPCSHRRALIKEFSVIR